MANKAQKAILTALLEGVLTEILPQTVADNVYVDAERTTTLATKIAEMVTTLDTKITNDDLTAALADYVKKEAGKGLSAEDFTAAFKAKLEGIESGAQVNKIEKISVNGVEQTITAKGVDIKMPTKVSELTNDSKFQTEDEVNAKISSVYKPGGSVAFASLPTAAEANLGYVYNVTDAFTTNANFVDGAGQAYPAGTNVVVVAVDGGYKYDVLSGFVDLSGYATKTEVADTVKAAHTHANKDTLDKIDAAKLTELESKGRVLMSKTEPEDLGAADLWIKPID